MLILTPSGTSHQSWLSLRQAVCKAHGATDHTTLAWLHASCVSKLYILLLQLHEQRCTCKVIKRQQHDSRTQSSAPYDHLLA